ncbi:MAG: O-antigen ligase family protein [Acidobacteria bacterium]|nr:MAG: O-antigen ligase family protein [Acidobacteriota bacterium]
MVLESGRESPIVILAWGAAVVFEAAILFYFYWSRIPAPQSIARLVLILILIGQAILVMKRERLALLAVLPAVVLSGSVARLVPYPVPPLPLFFSSSLLLSLGIKRVIEAGSSLFARRTELHQESAGETSPTSTPERPRSSLWWDLLGLFAALTLVSGVSSLLLYHNFYPLTGQPYFDYVINLAGNRSSQVTFHVLTYSANIFNACLILLALGRWVGLVTAKCLAGLLLASITVASVWAIAQASFDLKVLEAGGVWPSTGRLNGSFEDPNALAWTLIPLLPIAFAGLVSTPIWLRLLSLAASAAIFYQMYASASKTAFACAVLTACLLGVSGVIRAWRQGRHWLATSLLILAAMVPIALFTMVRTGPDILLFSRTRPLIEFFARQTPQTANLESLAAVASYRDVWWPSAWRMVREHPLTGVGVGVFAYETVNDGAPFDSAGNGYLQLAAELGIWGILAGLGGTLLVLVVSARRWWAAVGREKRETASLSAGVTVALVCCAAAQFFGSLLTFHQVFVTLVFVLALLFRLQVEAGSDGTTASHGRSQVRRPSRVIPAVLVVAFAALNLLGHRPTDPLEFRFSLLGREQNLIGGYPEEKWVGGFPFVWTNRVGYGRIRFEGGERVLRIHAAHPDIANRPVRVRFVAEGKLLAGVELRDSNWRDVPLRYRGPTDPKGLRVRVDVDRTWRPCDWGVSIDPRNLGIAIAGLD